MAMPAASSTTVWTVPDGKMNDFKALSKTHDINTAKGCVRVIQSQVGPNTVVSMSMYDTVENLEARSESSDRAAMLKTIEEHGFTFTRETGTIVLAMPGCVPRVVSDTRVGSYRKLKIKPGKMDEMIAAMTDGAKGVIVPAGRRGGFIVKIDDTTLVSHSAYNDQASLDTIDTTREDLKPLAQFVDTTTPEIRMTGPVVQDQRASRAIAAMSTIFMTVADGKMDEAMAWARAYDVRDAPGRFRMLNMQIDANTLLSASCYDTVESCEARSTSAAHEAAAAKMSALCTKVERFAGPLVFVGAGTAPRTYSENKVVSTRKITVLPGKMDALIAEAKNQYANHKVVTPGHRGAMWIKIDETTLLAHSVYNDQASLDANAENSKNTAALMAPFMADAGTKTVSKIVMDVWA